MRDQNKKPKKDQKKDWNNYQKHSLKKSEKKKMTVDQHC